MKKKLKDIAGGEGFHINSEHHIKLQSSEKTNKENKVYSVKMPECKLHVFDGDVEAEIAVIKIEFIAR